MAYLYRHIRLDTNQVFYIGVSSKECSKYKRAYDVRHRNRHWNYVVNSTDYEVEIMLDNLTIEAAFEKEKEFIKLYGRKDLDLGTLVNYTDGGEGLVNPTKETRAKISNIVKLFWKNSSEEFKQNKYKVLAAAGKLGGATRGLKLKGLPAYNRGLRMSDEKKKIISDKIKAIWLDKDSIYNTEEFRSNRNKKLIGKKRPAFSEETKKKMSIAAKERCKKYKNDHNKKKLIDTNTGIEYRSIREYCNSAGMSRYNAMKLPNIKLVTEK